MNSKFRGQPANYFERGRFFLFQIRQIEKKKIKPILLFLVWSRFLPTDPPDANASSAADKPIDRSHQQTDRLKKYRSRANSPLMTVAEPGSTAEATRKNKMQWRKKETGTSTSPIILSEDPFFPPHNLTVTEIERAVFCCVLLFLFADKEIDWRKLRRVWLRWKRTLIKINLFYYYINIS